MAKHELLINFADSTVADANIYAEDLCEQLLSSDETVAVERKRLDSTSMDFGPILEVMLSAPVTVALAKALIGWAKRNNQAHLQVLTKDGVVVADNLESKDVASVIRALGGK